MKNLAFALSTFLALPCALAAQAPTARAAEDALLAKHVATLRELVAGPPEAPRPQVLLLGTFHLDNPGLDTHKPKYTFDVFGEEGQRQLAELLARLAEFRPTKILVEQPSDAQGSLDRWYASYKAGNSTKTANEVVTVGFALAQRLTHERVYAFDARPEWLPTAPDTDEAMREEAERMGKLEFLEDPVSALYSRAYAQGDEIEETLSLRQRLRLLNHPDMLRASHGAYFFFAGFRVNDGENFPGPDGFASAWHNRNLRMFSNIQRLASAPDERLLVIVGAGHVPILQQCVQCCPTLAWVSAYDFLAPR
ncbi:MAG: hypothetical protein EXS08_04210 [Planctomycetes bacterium]|nr:hypothetical protein [Planctomycetota bacterium]